MKTGFRLIEFARRYWARLLLALLFLLAGTAFSLVVPNIIRQAIDGIGRGDQSSLTTAAFLIIGASLARGAFGFINGFLTEAVSQRVAYDMRNTLYDKFQRLSFAFHDTAQTGQLMSRATEDVEAVRRFISMGLLGFIQTGVLFIGVAVILLVLNWQLALLTLLFLPVIAYRAVLVGVRLRKVWRHIHNMLGDVGTILEENLTGVRVVKSFAQENEESRKFSISVNLLYNEELNADRQMAFNIPFMVFLIGLPTAVILWYGGRQVIAGTLTIGELTQFMLYLGIMAMPVRRLGYVTTLFSRSISAGQRIFEVLDRESPVKEKPDAVILDNVKGEVSFENVSFKYDSSADVLKEVSFVAHPSEMIAIVGGSGSGKSTIASLIPRFYDVNSGRILIDGHDVRDLTLVSIRKNIGIVQQDIFLFSATIKENIAYGAVNASMEDIVKAATIARLHEFIQSLPDGYDTMVGERGITLSGGEQQRLAIARTLLTHPRILILDDSTSSVDGETENAIRQALSHLVQDSTIFVITHRLSLTTIATRVLVLDNGGIVEQGTPAELTALKGIYRKISDSQMANPESQENYVR